MGLEIRNVVIKGKKEEINAILNQNSNANVMEVEQINNSLVVYRVDIGDVYAKDDLSDFFLTGFKNIQFLALANDEESFGDIAVFKKFGSTKIEKGPAFNPTWMSTFMEEFEGNMPPFLDKPFEFKMESYSDGEVYTIRNSMAFETQWKDDSMFSDI